MYLKGISTDFHFFSCFFCHSEFYSYICNEYAKTIGKSFDEMPNMQSATSANATQAREKKELNH